jgi:hypothetical protein
MVTLRSSIRGEDDVFRQLAFASRARDGLRPSDTSEIIGASRANNARLGVTGVLVYSGESFLQLVEGPDGALSTLWRKLIIDDRHRQLTALHDGVADARWFDDWRAGYVSENALAPLLRQWRTRGPALPPDDLEKLYEFLRGTEAY